MNKARRIELDEIISKLQDIQADIDVVMTDEQNAFDNLPEQFQVGERGAAMEDAIDCMSSAYDALDDVIEYLEDARG